MPSRADVRGSIEAVLRAVSIGVLAWMLWLSLDRGKKENNVAAEGGNLSAALRDWTGLGIAPDNISVGLDSVPAPRYRDWLSALNASGSKVSWSGALPAIGLEIQPVASPTRGYNVLVGAPAGSSVVIGDAIGPLDSLKSAAGGAHATVATASGTVTASAAGTKARANLPDTLKIRRVLVLGSASWETKFVTAALEEDGWRVDVVEHVAPGVSVTQGSITPIDTSRYAAVIAVDRWAAPYSADIVRYVATGGGVMIAPEAASLDGLSVLRAGAPGRVESASSIATEPGSVTLQSLPLMPVTGLKGDVVVIDRRGNLVTSAARRFGAGRVVQLGFLDTWRWRMSGGDNSVQDHRKFWTTAVAGVAYAPASVLAVQGDADNAPVAHLIAALGSPSSTARPRLAKTGGPVSLWLLFAILSLSLVAEWISRRSRGAR